MAALLAVGAATKCFVNHSASANAGLDSSPLCAKIASKSGSLFSQISHSGERAVFVKVEAPSIVEILE